MTVAVDVSGLSHSYGPRTALSSLSLQVNSSEIFGVLGPNGGGKTTLFRILSTLLPLQSGSVSILGRSLPHTADEIRRLIGVTFQAPSLDKKLTVLENLSCQGHLYGLSGNTLREKSREMLDRVGLADRSHDLVQHLSGGLQRRVEIAKGLLHSPRLLLLDEPSAGLDPAARFDLWKYLQHLRQTSSITILLTTHLMDEADRCDRLAILDQGNLVALGTPDTLRSELGNDCITIESPSAASLADKIRARFHLSPTITGEQLRLDVPAGQETLRQLLASFPDDILAITLGKPTLEDVFIRKTGHRFWTE